MSGENALDKFVSQSLSDSLALKVDTLFLFPLINVTKTWAPCVNPRVCQVLKKQKCLQKEIPGNRCHLKLGSHPSTKVVTFCSDDFVPNLTNELTGIFLGAWSETIQNLHTAKLCPT